MYSCIAQLLEGVAVVTQVACALDCSIQHACVGLGSVLDALQFPQLGHDSPEKPVVKNMSRKYCVSDMNRLGGWS